MATGIPSFPHCLHAVFYRSVIDLTTLTFVTSLRLKNMADQQGGCS